MGQDVECVVLEHRCSRTSRISLGLKQLEPDPWSALLRTSTIRVTLFSGKVRSITDYGVFIGIEEGVDGMVHKSDLSWSQRISNPADVYRKGDEVEAIILSINHEEKKVSLGIKQLYADPWTFIPERYPEGTILEVRAIAANEDGAIVELEQGVEGYVPRSEISTDLSVEPSEVIKAGEILIAQIVRLDADDHRVTLSLRSTEGVSVNDENKFDENRHSSAKTIRQVGPSKASRRRHPRRPSRQQARRHLGVRGGRPGVIPVPRALR